MATSILQARNINLALGGAVVGPGDIDELQEDMIDACQMLISSVPEMKRKMDKKK